MASQTTIFTVLLSLCLFASLSHAVNVNYCLPDVNYDVTVSNVDIEPNPIERGQPATFTISANTVNQIYYGQLHMYAHILGTLIHSETRDLCEETSCPVSSGDFVVSHTQTLPSVAPPGLYTFKMTMSDADGKQLTCTSFGFPIGFGSPVADI